MNEAEKRWKEDYKAFDEAAHKFFGKEMDSKTYKGISGGFGSYAQRGGEVSMLRLRHTAGRMDKQKLAFLVSAIDQYAIDKAHFTTCQAVQLHNLNEKAVTELAVKALSVGIITRGGGGDFPRNTMMSPLAGVEVGEPFNVLPYALVTGDYALDIVNRKKMPRKLKIAFSSTPNNYPHATFRDLGFVAREDGKFDVYGAGGLGNRPMFGVKLADGIEPNQVLYYVEAMYETFVAYGDYENRAHARTRFMQEICGGAEQFKEKYLEKLKAVYEAKDITITAQMIDKVMDSGFDEKAIAMKAAKATADPSILCRRVVAQKQSGLYAVKYHPIGGSPDMTVFRRLYETIKDMEQVEIRLCPDESIYIINLTCDEARAVMTATEDSAKTAFEESVACIGASICQQGVRDSQALLKACVEMERAEGFADGVLPQIHISGCVSSCGTHQTGVIGFHGGVKLVDKVPTPAFTLHVGGRDLQGQEKMGEQVGVILEKDIPSFLKELGKAVESSRKCFDAWYAADPEELKAIAQKYLA
ncbi:MAG: nitrite/sulfite reductase [Sphaerochaetaceae bacterium]|nr:nitrite/sulfite reductase [Sphaerochaetaceae bacterium]